MRTYVFPIAAAVVLISAGYVFSHSALKARLLAAVYASRTESAHQAVSTTTPDRTDGLATSTVASTTGAVLGTSARAGTKAKKPAVSTVPATKPYTIIQVQDETPGLALALPKLRSATVNVICIPSDRTLPGTSGSGVIIDSRGIVLTAAHVGQFFLLQKPNSMYRCVVRTGSPAARAYTAQVVYVSPAWIAANTQTITGKNRFGTGEHDFAVLAITGTADNSVFPSSFPSVPLTQDQPFTNEPAVLGSYGSEFLGTQQILNTLFPTLAFTTVKGRGTFDTDTVDFLSLGGGAAAQEGSSGGGAANEKGELIGILTTTTTGSDLNARDLRAITIDYIRRAFYADTHLSIDSYIANTSVDTLVQNFSSEDQSLASTLVRANNLR